MLVVGFDDATINAQSPIVKELQTYELGGVILFDRFYKERNRTKNISSPEQLKELTKQLKYYAKRPLLISIDQEGGKLQDSSLVTVLQKSLPLLHSLKRLLNMLKMFITQWHRCSKTMASTATLDLW